MPKAHKIFSIKKIKEEKLPDPGKRDHPTTRGIRTIRKEHREKLEDEECREHSLLHVLTAVTVQPPGRYGCFHMTAHTEQMED